MTMAIISTTKESATAAININIVLPSSKKLHLLGAIGVITAMPLRILPERIRQRLPFQEMHARATVCQHKALQMKLWEYGFITARK